MKKPITIEAYDPQWPNLYETEKRRLLGAIGDVIAVIEHVGSTAVPGLGAKPIIDIMIGVVELTVVERCITPLAVLDYKHMFSQPHWCHFSKPSYNLHLFVKGSDEWERHLLFRDYLRSHPKVATQYQALKQELAAKYLYNPAYVKAKASFVEAVIEQARQWRELPVCHRPI